MLRRLQRDNDSVTLVPQHVYVRRLPQLQQGARAIRALGLSAAVAEAGVSSRSHVCFDATTGAMIGRHGAATRTVATGDQAPIHRRNVHLPRQSLRALLYARLRPGTVRWGHVFLGASPPKDGTGGGGARGEAPVGGARLVGRRVQRGAVGGAGGAPVGGEREQRLEEHAAERVGRVERDELLAEAQHVLQLEGDVEEGDVRVARLEGEALDQQRAVVGGLRAVVLERGEPPRDRAIPVGVQCTCHA